MRFQHLIINALGVRLNKIMNEVDMPIAEINVVASHNPINLFKKLVYWSNYAFSLVLSLTEWSACLITHQEIKSLISDISIFEIFLSVKWNLPRHQWGN